MCFSTGIGDTAPWRPLPAIEALRNSLVHLIANKYIAHGGAKRNNFNASLYSHKKSELCFHEMPFL